MQALTPIKEAVTVKRGKNMYSFGAPIASAWADSVRKRVGLQARSQSSLIL